MAGAEELSGVGEHPFEHFRNFVVGRACGGSEPNDAQTQRASYSDAILDQLLAGADPKTAFDPNGLLDDLKGARGTRPECRDGSPSRARRRDGNGRNGYGRKTVVTDTGKLSASDRFINQASYVRQTCRFNWGRLPSAGGGRCGLGSSAERRISDGSVLSSDGQRG